VAPALRAPALRAPKIETQGTTSRSSPGMETPDLAEAQRGQGKGLGWPDDVNIALSRVAAGVFKDTVGGTGMRQALYARRIRAEFIGDPLRPAEVDRSNRDQCQWRPGACQGCGWAPFQAATHHAFREISSSSQLLQQR
jgi:hypothetical protein